MTLSIVNFTGWWQVQIFARELMAGMPDSVSNGTMQYSNQGLPAKKLKTLDNPGIQTLSSVAQKNVDLQ